MRGNEGEGRFGVQERGDRSGFGEGGEGRGRGEGMR